MNNLLCKTYQEILELVITFQTLVMTFQLNPELRVLNHALQVLDCK